VADAIENGTHGSKWQICRSGSNPSGVGLRSGEKLEVSLDEEGIHLRTQRQMIARSQAIMRKYASAGRCISDELIAERRLEAKREEEEFG